MEEVAERDITEAVNQIGLESKIKEIIDISGHNNRIFKVRIEDKTVISKFSTGENGSQDCQKEVNIHSLLKNQTDVRTPEILQSEASTQKTEFPFFITEYIEGESLQESFPVLHAEEQVEVVEQAGKILGEIHSEIGFQYAGELIPENGNIVVDGEAYWCEFITKELSKATEKVEKTRFNDLTEKAGKVVEKLSGLDEPNKSLVFYDFRPDNVISEDGKIKALIDFERAWAGDPLWDYAYSEMSFVEPHRYYDIHEPPNADEEELRKAFQRGYEKEIELEENWRQKIKLYKIGIIIKRFNSFKAWTESTEMTDTEIEAQEKLLRRNFDRLYQIR